MEAESGKKIRATRADNAQEYITLAQTIEPFGIAVKFTMPYLPEQDGVVER